MSALPETVANTGGRGHRGPYLPSTLGLLFHPNLIAHAMDLALQLCTDLASKAAALRAHQTSALEDLDQVVALDYVLLHRAIEDNSAFNADHNVQRLRLAYAHTQALEASVPRDALVHRAHYVDTQRTLAFELAHRLRDAQTLSASHNVAARATS